VPRAGPTRDDVVRAAASLAGEIGALRASGRLDHETKPCRTSLRSWAATGPSPAIPACARACPRLPFIPSLNLYIVTCIEPGRPGADPRPQARRGPRAAQHRRRITPAIIADIAYAGYLVDTKAPEGPYFEVAIVHHTDCGSTLLADDDLRHGFAQRIGTDERALAGTPVLDPARTVQTDVNKVLWAKEIPQNIHASGHVYDVGTGLVTTIVDARARK